jgi:hypothetical protein
MADYSEVFVGIDTSKLRNAVAIAEGGRNGEVRYLGEVENTEAATRKLVKKLAAQHRRVTSPPPLHYHPYCTLQRKSQGGDASRSKHLTKDIRATCEHASVS